MLLGIMLLLKMVACESRMVLFTNLTSKSLTLTSTHSGYQSICHFREQDWRRYVCNWQATVSGFQQPMLRSHSWQANRTHSYSIELARVSGVHNRCSGKDQHIRNPKSSRHFWIPPCNRHQTCHFGQTSLCTRAWLASTPQHCVAACRYRYLPWSCYGIGL